MLTWQQMWIAVADVDVDVVADVDVICICFCIYYSALLRLVFDALATILQLV